jgi:hypothetical protein
MALMTQPARATSLEQLAREELAVRCPELLDDDAWLEARENLLRLFVLLEAFTAPEDTTTEDSVSQLINDKIAQ